MSKECRQVNKLIGLYVDGEVNSLDQIMIERHVGECERCASELSARLRVSSLVADAVAPAVSAEIPESVFEALAAVEIEPEPERRVPAARPLSFGLAAAAACLCLVLLGSWWLGLRSPALVASEGPVRIKRAHRAQWKRMYRGDRFGEGDTIVVCGYPGAVLRLAGGATATLGSDFVGTMSKDGIRLESGDLVVREPGARPTVVAAAGFRITPVGTEFAVSASASAAWVATIVGRVRVEGGGGSVDVKPWERVDLLMGQRPGSATPVANDPRLDAYWAYRTITLPVKEDRFRQVTVVLGAGLEDPGQRRRLADRMCLLRTMLVDDPSNVAAHIELGAAYRDIADLGRSASEYRAALKHDPDNTTALLGLGETLWRAQDPGCVPWFSRAVERGLGPEDDLVARGKIAYYQRDPETAIDLWQQALDLPAAAQARIRFYIAQALGRMGRQEAKIEVLQKIVDLNGAEEGLAAVAAAYNNMSNAMMRLSRLTDSIHALERAVEIAPNYSVAVEQLGARMAMLGVDREAAFGYLHRAIELDPHDYDAWSGFAQALWWAAETADDRQEALAFQEDIVARFPRMQGAHLELAQCAANAGMYRIALQGAQAELDLFGDQASPEVYDVLGIALDGLGRKKEAQEMWQRWLGVVEARAPWVADKVRAITLSRLGRGEDAAALWDEILDPTNPEDLSVAALAQSDIGRYNAAAKYYARAIRLRQHAPQQYDLFTLARDLTNYAKALHDAGRRSEARAAFAEAEKAALPLLARYHMRKYGWFYMGIICENTGRLDDARRYYRLVVERPASAGTADAAREALRRLGPS
jgi:tetratricopeptide (TPR) repeat protein